MCSCSEQHDSYSQKTRLSKKARDDRCTPERVRYSEPACGYHPWLSGAKCGRPSESMDLFGLRNPVVVGARHFARAHEPKDRSADAGVSHPAPITDASRVYDNGACYRYAGGVAVTLLPAGNPLNNSPASMSISTPLDTLIQAAVVDLFQSHNVAVAPVARATAATARCASSDTAAQISFSSPAATGSLSLSLPDELVKAMGGDSLHMARDRVREMTNQLMGRIKSRLIHFGVLLQTGLPTMANCDLLRHALEESETARIFVFRSLRGDILVALDGAFDESRLKYIGRAGHGTEGDVILF